MIIEGFTALREGYIEGKLAYSKNDLSYDYTCKDISLNSLLEESGLIISHTLEIAVDLRHKRLLYVSGYCPTSDIIIMSLAVQPQGAGSVHVFGELNLSDKNISFETDLYDSPVYYDPAIQWACIGQTDCNNPIMIADGVGISLDGNKLASVWLNAEVTKN